MLLFSIQIQLLCRLSYGELPAPLYKCDCLNENQPNIYVCISSAHFKILNRQNLLLPVIGRIVF